MGQDLPVSGHAALTLSDIDTFVVRAYKPNDNFQHLIDTIFVVNPGLAIYTTSNDTTIIDVGGTAPGDGDPRYRIVSGYDWQIYIPALNRTVTITSLKFNF